MAGRGQPVAGRCAEVLQDVMQVQCFMPPAINELLHIFEGREVRTMQPRHQGLSLTVKDEL